jgi:hypothetical protein
MTTVKQILFVENDDNDDKRGTFERYHAEGSILRTDKDIRVLVSDEDNVPTRIEVDGHLLADKLRARSDKKLKQQIKPIANAMETINNLNGVEYYYRNDMTKSYGLIAQDVQSVIPTVVSKDSDGYLNINYLEIIAFLIENIKELNKKVNSLEMRNNI